MEYYLATKGNEVLASSQDGGVGRYTLLSRTTKRRKTTDLKTKNN